MGVPRCPQIRDRVAAVRRNRLGEIVAPADGPVSWTTPSDLAEAAAIILADPGRFDGPTPPLTAPDLSRTAHPRRWQR